MTKLHFGCGPNYLEDGWQNFQQHEQDITQRLRWNKESVDYILVEHVVEHITHGEALKFFRDSYRVLKTGGVLRVIVPSVSKIWNQASLNEGYLSLMQQAAPNWWPVAGMEWHGGKVTREDCVDGIVYCHGHKSCWDWAVLGALLQASGFQVTFCVYRESVHPELNDVDSHWKLLGLENCVLESIVAEGQKPE